MLVLEKFSQINKSLAILIKTQREKIQITDIWNEGGNIIIDSEDIKKHNKGILWTALFP